MRHRREGSIAPSRRITHFVWTAFRAFSVLCAAVVTAILLSLDLPPVRRLVVRQVDELLLSTFAGRVVVEEVEHLALGGIRGARVRVIDPDGEEVLLVENASVRFSLASLARSALLGRGEMRIEIADVSLGYVDANIDIDPSGNLRLAKAFEPKRPRSGSTPASSERTVVRMRRVTAAHAWLHGRPRGAPFVDADLDHVELSALIGPNASAVDLARIDISTRGMPNEANLRLRGEAHYAAPSKTGSDKEAHVDVTGTAGGIAVRGHGSLDGQDIAVTIDVPRTAPEAIRTLVPNAPVYDIVEAHAEAHGHLPDIETSARLALGRGTVEIRGHVVAAENMSARATLVARDIDARASSKAAPPSALGAHATIEVTSHARGDIAGTYSFDLIPGTIAGNAVPRAHVHGEIEVGGSDQGAGRISVSGTGAIEERGAPTRLDFRLWQSGESPTLGFELDASVPRLDQTRLGPTVEGSLALRARGTLGLGAQANVDADLAVTTSDLRHGDQRLRNAWMRAHLRGPSQNPLLDVIAQANGVVVRGTRFASGVVTVHGAMRTPDVTLSVLPVDGPRIEGRARIETGETTSVRDARLTVSRDDVHAAIEAALVRVGPGEVRAEGIRVDGLGDTIRMEGRKTGRRLVVRASTNELDLARLSRLLELRDIKEGHLGLDVDLALDASGARGHARVDLVEALFARMRHGSAHLDASFEGRSVVATAHARLGQLGSLDMDPCRVDLDRAGPLDFSAWKSARGNVVVHSKVDIARLRALLPRGALPFDEMQGVMQLSGQLARDSTGTEMPELRFSASTEGLLLSGKGEREQVDGTRVIASPPWRLEGVDIELAASIDEGTGETALTTRLFDREGTLASLDARSPALPYGHWLRTKAISLESLRGVALEGQMEIPEREVKTLPPLLGTQEISGRLAAKVNVKGPLLDPAVRLAARATGVASSVNPIVAPIDADVAGLYENGAAKVDVDLVSAGRRLLHGSVDVQGSVAELLRRAEDRDAPWEASSRVQLVDFPLETLTYVSDLAVKGRASGELSVDDVHKDGRARADIALRDLELGRAKFPRGSASLEFDGTLLRGALRLDQRVGFVEAEGQIGMAWGNALVPRTTGTQPMFASLKADRFQAVAIVPFVPGVFTELDGRIDADARIEGGSRGSAPKMRGTIALADGRVQLTRVGEPFHGVAGKIALTPDGIVRLTDATAYASTGKVMASGVARVNGFRFLGGQAAIRIPSRQTIPVDIDGEEIGDVDGEVNIKADVSPDQRSMNIDVDIPRLHTVLPLSSTHKVQTLGEPEDIRVGYFRRRNRFVLLAKDAEDLESRETSNADSTSMQTNVAIHLGNDIELKRGTTLRVLLEGNPSVRITDKTRVYGQLRLKRGNLEVQGKRFDIERGTVSFVGEDPYNPQVVITAGWTAPDGTRVYADFTGPLKTGKVKLRAEPTRPQNEILALIMFGTADGSSATPYASPAPDGASRAGAFAGSFATEGLSRGLDELTGLEVSTKIDTTNAANPRPEIEVQIARDISVQIGYVIGTPPRGTTPDKTLVTLDWRFRRNWSLEATFGDQGSSIMDLVWQYRY